MISRPSQVGPISVLSVRSREANSVTRLRRALFAAMLPITLP